MYKELSTQLNFPDLEQTILDYWDENGIFQKSITTRDAGKPFIFYEGPPTANGKPGIHHVISRTIKDLVCRFKTMQGYRVERKAGWDTHGLPVEIQVEKELGFKNKDDVEKYGVANFNAKCRESVWQYKSDWDQLTRRIGYWVDLSDPYITYENNYIESVWWILCQIWNKGLLYKGHKIVPYCPRCETPLSSHEVSQGYRDVEDPSVYVKMPIKGEPDTSFLVWTTTPWTLISNVAVALNPDIEYVKVKSDDEFLILAKSRLSVVTDEATIVESYKGAALIGKDYEPLFTFVKADKRLHYSVAGDFVSTDDGSGIVHIAPAFGEDDYKVGRENDLPFLQPVDASGRFVPEVTPYAGQFVKDADPRIIEDLKSHGRLFKSQMYTHSYPHCWRCDSPLLYYAKESWFIKTTAIKERLVANNKQVDWYPKEVGTGRFGEWLENNIDWSLSRDRYWGTPLPIWQCEACDAAHCIGSIEELRKLSAREEIADLHKPFVDDITIPCQKCGATMRRTPEVIDVWFDSGSMPVAQWHFPFENQDIFERSFPADFISEGVDQTRGWFYSLLAIATLVFDKPCYKACISNDLILDKNGQKMSKTRGNAVNPESVLNECGADALRWYLISVSPPWVPTRFDSEGVREVLRKFLGTLLNVYSFFAIYTNIDKFTYVSASIPVKERAEIDRWLTSSLNALVARIEAYMERYDLTKVARAISDFVLDELSNWYVRRCRRRFWKSDLGRDKMAAFETLYEVLLTLAKLMAPLAPFFSEEVYLNLTRPSNTGTESVHLETYPSKSAAAFSYRDAELEARMGLVRRIVNLGRLLRNESNIKVRQPLSRIVVVAKKQSTRDQVSGMTNLILEEINVKKIEFVTNVEDLTLKRAVPQFKRLGPRLGKMANPTAAAIKELEHEQITELERAGNLRLTVAEEVVEIVSDDIEILSESAEGLMVQNDNELTVALDTVVTPELREEGLAREFVNRVQNMRKSAGYDVVDRINIYTVLSDELGKAVQKRADYIRNETLADKLVNGVLEDAFKQEWEISGSRETIAIQKVA
jgi:isoleucyl-tRNA synthetase